MKVKIELNDNSAFTAEELIQIYKKSLGQDCIVDVLPENSNPEDYIYFGILNLITVEQLEYYFSDLDSMGLYNEKINRLKKYTIEKVSHIFDKVIKNNETKVSS